MNDADATGPRLTWTEDGNIVLPMLPAYDDDEGASRRAALDSDDAAWNLVAAVSWVLDGMGRMRNRLGPEQPAGVFAAAEDLIQAATAMQDELAMSTMASHGTVARIKGLAHRQTAASRLKAVRASEETISDEDRQWRYRIGLRPRDEDARTWYRDSYYEENEAAEARADAWEAERARRQRRNSSRGGSTVVNISTGTTGIQSGGTVNDEDIDL